jgi:uncharacterized protein (TIGR03085 family)
VSDAGQATVADRIGQERAALVATLRSVGSDAPTLAGGWTSADLAAHLAATEQFRGVPTFLGRRAIVRFGWRLNDTFRPVMSMDLRRFRRHGFEWAVRRLERPLPTLLRLPSIAPITAFEVFVHHEDIRRANAMPARVPAIDLTPSLRWLLRYQRPLLRDVRVHLELPDGRILEEGAGPTPVVVSGPPGETLLWLAGRPAAVSVTPESARSTGMAV